MSMEKLFQVVEGLRQTATADAAFGQPKEAEGRVIIPVSAVGTGFGLGFGRGMSQEAPAKESKVPWDMDETPAGDEDEAGGGGGGGGANSHPVAMIEVTPEGTIVRAIVDETKVALAGIALAGWCVFLLLVTIRAVFGHKSE